MNSSIFYVYFEDNYFNKGDIINSGNHCKFKVMQTPHKKWYKQLLQFITFGLYEAPTQYKVKQIDDEKA